MSNTKQLLDMLREEFPRSLARKEVIEEMLHMFDHLTPRDPARIVRILAKLGDIWIKHPDQRLFQLLENLFGCPDRWNKCLFAQEDDTTEKRLTKFLETGQWGRHG